MGYYSDAALCLRERDFKELLAEEKKVGSDAYNFLALADITVIDECGGDKVLCVRWTSVKWYHDFEEIQVIEAWMDEGNGYHPYNFVRLGEDYEDIEHRQSSNYEFDEYIYPERYIGLNDGAFRIEYIPDETDDGSSEEVQPVSDADRDSIFEMIT